MSSDNTKPVNIIVFLIITVVVLAIALILLISFTSNDEQTILKNRPQLSKIYSSAISKVEEQILLSPDTVGKIKLTKADHAANTYSYSIEISAEAKPKIITNDNQVVIPILYYRDRRIEPETITFKNSPAKRKGKSPIEIDFEKDNSIFTIQAEITTGSPCFKKAKTQDCDKASSYYNKPITPSTQTNPEQYCNLFIGNLKLNQGVIFRNHIVTLELTQEVLKIPGLGIAFDKFPCKASFSIECRDKYVRTWIQNAFGDDPDDRDYPETSSVTACGKSVTISINEEDLFDSPAKTFDSAISCVGDFTTETSVAKDVIIKVTGDGIPDEDWRAGEEVYVLFWKKIDDPFVRPCWKSDSFVEFTREECQDQILGVYKIIVLPENYKADLCNN